MKTRNLHLLVKTLFRLQFILVIAFTLLSYNGLSQNGVVKGRVFDAINNEALPFVNVVVENTTVGAITDIDGNFIITGLQPGFIRLSVSFIGYENATSPEVQISNAKPAYVEIALKETDQKLDEIVVKANPFRKTEEAPLSLRTIGIKEIENSPGSNRDISKVIQSFPGVAFTSVNRSDIIVRGGGSSESRFYLDGIEVPNINHFATQGASGGSNGILNADFIREVNFYSGAFPASRGNALSAVFEFRQIDGNKDDLKFRGTVGASEISLTADGPVGEKTTFIASARRSYLQFLFDAIGLPFLPTFNDFQFKSRTRIDNKNEITVIGLGAIDEFALNLGIDNPTEDQQYILNYLPVNEQWNYTLGVVYKHFREKSYQTIAVSRNMLDNTSYKYRDNDDSSEDNKILDYSSWEIENKIRLENTYRQGGYKINYGINGEFAKYTNDTYQQIFIRDQLVEIDYNTLLEIFKWGAFGQISKNMLNDRLTLSAGIRMDANNYSASMSNMFEQFSPRFSASYMLAEQVSVNFNTGRYYQLPAYTTLGFRLDDKLVNKNNNLKYITADHLIGGFEFRPGKTSLFTLEGFYKKYNNYPFSAKDSISISARPADFGTIGDEEVYSTAEGRAYGVEFLNQNRFPNNYNLVLSYTYVISEFLDKFGAYAPSSFDNRHLLIITASKLFRKDWQVGLKWRYAGGLPYTPYDLERSSLISAWDVRNQPYLNYAAINSERLEPFHQLDFRVDKSFYLKKTTLRFYIDVQNAYNFKSDTQNRVTNLDTDGQKIYDTANPLRYDLRTIPSEGSGSVLPTVGVIIDF